MQTPCQGGHRGVQTQSYGGTGPCWPPPPPEPPLSLVKKVSRWDYRSFFLKNLANCTFQVKKHPSHCWNNEGGRISVCWVRQDDSGGWIIFNSDQLASSQLGMNTASHVNTHSDRWCLCIFGFSVTLQCAIKLLSLSSNNSSFRWVRCHCLFLPSQQFV